MESDFNLTLFKFTFMVSKQKAFDAFRLQVKSRIQAANEALREATESVHSETKGSAGDKHETGRAMAQLEVENTGKILQEAQNTASVLHLLEPEKVRTKCSLGALVETTQGLFYLSGGIGKITVGNNEIFCIGMNSPLGQALIGKGIGEYYNMAGKEQQITGIS